jgi:DNA-binding transcriptional regulator PaaX
MSLGPIEDETLQILRMDAERTELLLTMFPEEMGVEERRLATCLDRLEAMGLVACDRKPDGEWWCLTAAGRDHAVRAVIE